MFELGGQTMLHEQRAKVTVVIPAFNAAAFIEEAVRSAIAQDYRPLEVLVVDDCSSDGTVDRARSLEGEARAAGVQLRVIGHTANLGASQALATGFEAASGEFVGWLSADDTYITRDKTAVQVQAMIAGLADMSYSTSFLAGPSLESSFRVRESFVPDPRFEDSFVVQDRSMALCAMFFGNPINGSSVLVRKEAYMRAGGFDPALRNVDADGDLWMRMIALGMKILPVEGCTVYYRLHAAQTTQTDPSMRWGVQLTRLRMLRTLFALGSLCALAEGGAAALDALIAAGRCRAWHVVSWEMGRLLSCCGSRHLRPLSRRLRGSSLIPHLLRRPVAAEVRRRLPALEQTETWVHFTQQLQAHETSRSC